MSNTIEDLYKKYPFSAFLEATAKVIKLQGDKKNEAFASIDKLSGILSEESIEAIENNPDLLYIASNLIQLNWANLNDDCILAEEIVSEVDNFKLKFFDLDHDRKKIVGVVTDVGFSLLGSNDNISAEAALKQIDPPVLLNVGGVLWRLVNKNLCEFAEESSYLQDGKISTSFEVIFSHYDIGYGSNGDRNAKNARIIKPEDQDFEKYDKILKFKGGTGKIGNDIVFRIFRNILPTGAGLVAVPASGIRGILAISDPESIETDDDEDENESEAKKDNSVINVQFLPDINNNIILTTSSVIENNNTKLDKPMELPKIEKTEDIVSKWADLQKHEAAASVVTEFIKQQFIEKSKEFAAEIKAKEDALKDESEHRNSAEAKVKELEAAIDSLNQELKKIREAQASAQAQELFSNRMSMLDNEFELDDEDRAFLAEEVRSIESDEAFAKYFDKQKKLMSGKKKVAKSECMKDKDGKAAVVNKEVEAVASVNVNEVVVSAVETPNQVIPNDPVVQVSLKDQIKDAFLNKTSVGGKKINKK